MIAWRIQQKLRRLRVKTKQNQAHTNNTRNKRRSTEQKAVRGRNSYKHFGGSCHFRWHRCGQVRQRYMMIGLRICILPLYILCSRSECLNTIDVYERKLTNFENRDAYGKKTCLYCPQDGTRCDTIPQKHKPNQIKMKIEKLSTNLFTAPYSTDWYRHRARVTRTLCHCFHPPVLRAELPYLLHRDADADDDFQRLSPLLHISTVCVTFLLKVIWISWPIPFIRLISVHFWRMPGIYEKQIKYRFTMWRTCTECDWTNEFSMISFHYSIEIIFGQLPFPPFPLIWNTFASNIIVVVMISLVS